MRKKAITVVLIPLVIIGVLLYFFLNSWVEYGLERAAEKVVGARVEIDHLRLSFSPLGMSFSRLQVANPRDPWKNLFETQTVQFSMDAGQLLRGKYIIELVEVQNLIFGTKRTTDGSLPESRRGTGSIIGAGPSFSQLAAGLVDQTVDQTPIFNLDNLRKGINIDSLIRAQNFLTLRHIDTVRQRVGAASAQWTGIQADIKASTQRLVEIERSLRTINPPELKTVEQVTTALTTVKNARNGIDEVVQTVSVRQASIGTDIQGLTAAIDSIDDYAARDFQKVLSLARLPNMKTFNVAELLLGKKLMGEVATYLHWIDFGRQTIKKYTPKPEIESPPRMQGQNIFFPVERGYPKLWIKKVLISGGTDASQDPEFFYARGEALNITNNQSATGLPMSIDLKGTKGGKASLRVAALIDRTKAEPLDEYNATLTGLRLSDFALGRSAFLPSRITNARLNTSVAVTIPGRKFDSRASFQFENLGLEFSADPRNAAERIVRNVLLSVKGFSAGLRLWTTGAAMDAAFSTDLDDQLAARLREVLGAELSRLQNEVKAKVDQVIAQHRRDLEQLYAAKRKEAEAMLQQYQLLRDQNIALVESKKTELTAQLEKLKKGAAEDLLNKIFKK